MFKPREGVELSHSLLLHLLMAKLRRNLSLYSGQFVLVLAQATFVWRHCFKKTSTVELTILHSLSLSLSAEVSPLNTLSVA